MSSAKLTAVPLTHLIPVESLTAPIDFDRYFKPDQPVELEIGCGNGRFLATRATRNPHVGYLGIERMLERVRKVNKKATVRGLENLYVWRMEAFYTFYYLLPRHRLRSVYLFFPDPWPKKKHQNHRLVQPAFLDPLWARLEIGGEIQIATDDAPYYAAIREVFDADPRFEPIAPIVRDEEEQTDFEQLFLRQGLSIHAIGYRTLPAPEPALAPLRVTPDREPRAADDAQELRSSSSIQRSRPVSSAAFHSSSCAARR